ncbi:MAG: prolyl oligopeptidase family serine peptidase, partial [Candidatus Promineifilaceae bacterium]|nr:prolyl oligopeptidase family serine peptidase [Candidatus Promineifilaceae bacterium]
GVTFRSDGYLLLGTLFLARGSDPKPTALILHGVPGIEKNYDLALTLREQGWNSLIFHFRGSWGSSGSYSISTQPADTYAAIDHLDSGKYSEVDREKLFLIGHSLGGWAAVIAGACDDRVQGVAVYGAISDPRALTFSRKTIADDFVRYLSGIDPHTFAQEWSGLGEDHVPLIQVGMISPRPILIIHAERDKMVPFSQSEALFGYAREPKELCSHPDANHAFTWHRPWLIQKLSDWLKQQI